MKIRNVLMSFLAVALLWSCSKDKDSSGNSAPTIKAQSFSVPESFTEKDVIGAVVATDADKDALTFSITTNDNNLFAISKAGSLSLASGKSLDFATKAQHVITVAVSDGEASATAKVNINVTQVDPENLAPAIEAQQFEAIESISDTEVIGTVAATDPEDDTLGFAIAVNDNDLFEIDPLTGELSLAEGMKLAFGNAQEHTITIGVSDGNSVSTADVTITVTEDPAPIGDAQEFNAMENISDTHIIGTVDAEDPEGQPITFSIKTNDNDLFEITEGGELSLAEGMALDFETIDQHDIVVSVSDGFNSIDINVSIIVLDDGLMSDDPASFVTTWTIPNDNFKLTIGLFADGYDFTIDWGDGTIEHFVTDAGTIDHDYALADNYTVAIQGIFPTISMGYVFVPEESKAALSSIEQWGEIAWTDFSLSFNHCLNLVYNASDKPDLSKVTSMKSMFSDCSSFNGDLSGWDVSNVSNMDSMFKDAISFNQPIGSWDVSNVSIMDYMFYGASTFNQDLSGWNDKIGNVTSMDAMFANASAFDQSLASWEIASVTSMSAMLDSSGMSPENLNATLIGWNNYVDLNNAPKVITLGVDNLTACGTDANAAYLNLWFTHGWTFEGNFVVNQNCN